jgi:hypothetical protein
VNCFIKVRKIQKSVININFNQVCCRMEEFSGDEHSSDIEVNMESRGRKRRRNESSWKRNENKLKRQSGQSYKDINDKTVAKKKFKKLSMCCNNMCFKMVSPIEQEKVFKDFYALEDHSKQSMFLNNCLLQQEIISHKVNCEKNILTKWEYNLPLLNKIFLG